MATWQLRVQRYSPKGGETRLSRIRHLNADTFDLAVTRAHDIVAGMAAADPEREYRIFHLVSHEWRLDGEAMAYRCRVCDSQYDGTLSECPGADDSLDPSLATRLRHVQYETGALLLDLRAARGGASGLAKTKLRAVGRYVENAAVELNRAVERAGL